MTVTHFNEEIKILAHNWMAGFLGADFHSISFGPIGFDNYPPRIGRRFRQIRQFFVKSNGYQKQWGPKHMQFSLDRTQTIRIAETIKKLRFNNR